MKILFPQISLIEGCQRILVSDCYSLLEKKVRGQQRGQHVDEDEVCRVCNCKIVTQGKVSASSSVVIAFKCRHVFHSDCLGERNECGLCSRMNRAARAGAEDD